MKKKLTKFEKMSLDYEKRRFTNGGIGTCSGHPHCPNDESRYGLCERCLESKGSPIDLNRVLTRHAAGKSLTESERLWLAGYICAGDWNPFDKEESRLLLTGHLTGGLGKKRTITCPKGCKVKHQPL